jgi:hypothetical protein
MPAFFLLESIRDTIADGNHIASQGIQDIQVWQGKHLKRIFYPGQARR